ncbi:hypothetical protein DV736_g3899, partial [Chaetothyriales sp. CBS 134916]
MATVISLLSSSPEQYPETAKRAYPRDRSHAPNAKTVGDLDHFDSNVLRESQPKHPAKKRKLTPTIEAESDRIKTTCVVDLSSEPHLPYIQPAVYDNIGLHSKLAVNVEEELDEISFTSSAPKLGKQKSTLNHSGQVFELSSDSLPDDLFQAFQNNVAPFTLKSKPASKKHHGLLAPPEPTLPVHSTTSNTKIPIESAVLDETIASSPPGPRRKTKSQYSASASVQLREDNKFDRRAAAASSKAERQAQRAVEKAIKQREKEAKAKERQLAAHKAEVNKSKVSKNDTTADMIIEMSASLADTAVGNLVQESMQELNVDTSFVEDPINPSYNGYQCHCPRSIVRWKRNVNSEYDHDHDEWVPLSRHRCQPEKHILLYMTALEFVSVLAGCPACGRDSADAPDEATIRSNVDMFMTRFRSAHGDCIPILLIQGLEAWLRKKTNTRNREFAAAVRAEVPTTTYNHAAGPPSPSQRQQPSSQAKRRKRQQPSPVPEPYLALITPDLTSSITLHLQLTHYPLIIQYTRNPDLAAVEITKFTQHLSTRPGRLAFQSFNLKSASFCMETGQVRTGDNARDVYAKMLQAVQRVTPSMAYGIVSEYETVGDLVKGFKEGGDNGRMMLQDVHKSMNRDGAWSDRKLGPMVSKRLYRIFMGRDPAARDGMA